MRRALAAVVAAGSRQVPAGPAAGDPVPVSTGGTKDPEVVSTPLPDPGALERAGWTNAELIWEQIQETAAGCEREGDHAAAAELWRGAREVAREHLSPGDLRVATSEANVGVAARHAGDPGAAHRSLARALALWDAGDPWLASLEPTALARSSTFHLRLQRKHRGASERFARRRCRTLADEGRALLAARRDGLPDLSDRLARWRRERPPGFDDWRRLLGAVLLIASGRSGGAR